MSAKAKQGGTVRVRQIKSGIGYNGQQKATLKARGLAVHGEQRQAFITTCSRTAGQHDNKIGGVTIEDETLCTIEDEPVARSSGCHFNTGRVPKPVIFGKRQGRDSLTAGDRRQTTSPCAAK